jgi:endonuclease YncB( thermonuclease family)
MRQLLAAAAAAGPATLVSVGDGDTIRVTGANRQKVTIRMACSGACPLCGVAEGLRSAAATGKPLAASWAVVVGVGSCGGVVA